jgi:hypothetical protein
MLKILEQPAEAGITRGKNNGGGDVVVLWGRGISFECRDFDLHSVPRSGRLEKILAGLVEKEKELFSDDVAKIVEQAQKEHPGCSIAVCTTRIAERSIEIIAIRNLVKDH